MTAFHPIPPKQAIEMVARAGIRDPQRLIIDFATAGLAKTYALVIETRHDDGRLEIVRAGAISSDLWRRMSQQGLADDVWSGGTVRLPAVPVEGRPEVSITGVSFSEKSLQRLIDHHGGAPSPNPQPAATGPAVSNSADDQPLPEGRQPDPSAIPSGAILVTVNQAMAALGLGRTKINELMNDGRLVRVKLDRGTRIEVESIRRLAGTST